MKRRLLASLIPAVFLFSGPVHADIYAFVDSNGIRHLSNVPNDNRYKLVMRTPAYRTPSPQSSSFAPSNLYSSYTGYRPGTWSSQSYYPRVNASPRPRRVNEQNRQRFSADVDRIATQYRLDPALLHAVISAESSYNPWAVSPKGAMGLMQLMPGTANRFGVGNPYDPISNMHGGARYLRWLLDQFNDTRLAVAAYNAGEGAVQKYGNQIPPYSETRTYVTRVLGFYEQYKGGMFYSASANTALASNPRVYGSGYTGATSSYGNRTGGITILTPRSIAARGSTGSATIPSTYLTPTGTRIIVGNSSGMPSRSVRPPVIYSSKPNPSATAASSASTAPLFAGNDK